MFFLLRKQLLLDTDARELARVRSVLDQHRIPYEIKTTVSENTLARNFNARAAQHRFSTYSDVSRQTYLYRLYVRRRDYPQAFSLAYK